MNPKDSPDTDNPQQKEKILPTYVFGEDYKQTVNLSDKVTAEQKNKDSEQDFILKDSTIIKDDSNTDPSDSVDSELKNLENPKPISMIVTKKKFRLKFLVFILFIAGLALAAIYAISILLDQNIIGNKNSRVVSGISTEKLVCELEGNNSELLTTGNALESTSRIEASYFGGDFVDILQTFEAKFENSSTAKIAMSNARSTYVKRFKSFGIATEPFKSEYSQNDTSIVVTHYADTSTISGDNAAVVHISVNQNDVVIYDIDSIKSNYEELGYACRVE